MHPREQWESARGVNRSPFHPRTEALGAEYFEARGWERPQWYASNEDLVARYGVPDRPHEWDRRWWSPIINAEHLHLREKVGVVDLGAFQIFEVSGPGALPYLERMTVNACDRPVGSSIYTPLLTPGGGFRADLTIQRLADDRFRIVTGVSSTAAGTAFWFRKHLPPDGSVHFEDRSSAISTLGVWGPDARGLGLESRGLRSRVRKNSATARCGEALIDGIPATLLRISYVGEGGWEIYTRTEHALALWDAIRGAGREFDARPVGDRCLRHHRHAWRRATSSWAPNSRPNTHRSRRGWRGCTCEAGGLHRQGRVPERPASRGPAARICTLTMDDHIERVRHRALPDGRKRADPDAGRGPHHRRAGDRESRVTSAGMGPSLGKYLLLAWLPAELAQVGERLQAMYMNECFPVTVAAVGTGLFDASGSRMRA